jgi:hypothetical protein
MEASTPVSAHKRCNERSPKAGQKGVAVTEWEGLGVADAESPSPDPAAAAETPPPPRLGPDREQEPGGTSSHVTHAHAPRRTSVVGGAHTRTHGGEGETAAPGGSKVGPATTVDAADGEWARVGVGEEGGTGEVEAGGKARAVEGERGRGGRQQPLQGA